MLLVCLIVSVISCSVISSVVLLYHECSTAFIGLYSACHSADISLLVCALIHSWKCFLTWFRTLSGSVFTIGFSPCVTILSIFIVFFFLSMKLLIILFLSVSSQFIRSFTAFCIAFFFILPVVILNSFLWNSRIF